MIRVADFVMGFLAKKGLGHIFMLSGGGCMHLVDALHSKPLQYVCNLHEQAAVIAAEAYGQYTRKLGVALVTTGPGSTNAITGLAGAWLDSTPILVLSGQVKRADLVGDRGVRQMGPQEINIVPIVKSITKYAHTIMEPTEILFHLEKAYHLATTGRTGPVWLDIPLDVQGALVDETQLKGFTPDMSSNRSADIEHWVSDTIKLLNQAERPLIIAGNGIRMAGAAAQFLQLVDVLKIPVLTTWKGSDLVWEAHPQFFGRPGSIGQRCANFVQQNADVVICLGARLDAGQTAYNHANFARAAKKIVVDIDANEIKKLQFPMAVAADVSAKDFIETLLERAAQVNLPDQSIWQSYCRRLKATYPTVLPEYWAEKNYVNHYVLMDVLSELLNEGELMASGSSGPCVEVCMQSFRLKKGQRLINTEGLGSMGFGLPAAIGACVASGGKRTVCVNGDGGFQLNIQELETVVRLKLPIKFFVLVNGGYNSIKTTQDNYFEGRYVASGPECGVTLPDIIKVAGAYGLKTAEILDHTDIKNKVQAVLDTPGPVLCSVRIDPQAKILIRVKSVMDKNGVMKSLPMEDLAPFLPRAEFKANMLIPPLPESLALVV